MFIIEVDGVKVLYTGDYSCEEDRYIMKAEIPQSNVDILIAESTFGVRVHESRRMREQKFQEYVHKIVKGGGKCLLPVFSAGRAEELLFILDEYWEQKSEELGHIQIYYTVSLIDKCRNIYETYIDMLSKKIRERFYK
jgi:cleavage and polyadenylation specificity factor subunit 3